MIVLYGLGNNEPKYLKTKHNIGRVLMQKYSEEMAKNDPNLNIADQFAKKDSYHYLKSKNITFAYSNGYMNESGKPLADLLNFFSFSFQKNDVLFLLQDDSDQVEGAVKLVQGGGTAGHRGVESVYQNVKKFGFLPENIWRLKIGIRPEQNRLKSETFVLSNLSEIDEKTIQNLAKNMLLTTPKLIQKDFAGMQNILNTKG